MTLKHVSPDFVEAVREYRKNRKGEDQAENDTRIFRSRRLPPRDEEGYTSEPEA